MNTDWIKTLAPMIGTALAGPLGGAAAGFLAYRGILRVDAGDGCDTDPGGAGDISNRGQFQLLQHVVAAIDPPK